MRDNKQAHRQGKRYSTKYPIKHVSWKRDDEETVLPSEGSEVDDSLLKKGTLVDKTDRVRGPLQGKTRNQQEEE